MALGVKGGRYGSRVWVHLDDRVDSGTSMVECPDPVEAVVDETLRRQLSFVHCGLKAWERRFIQLGGGGGECVASARGSECGGGAGGEAQPQDVAAADP